MWKVQEPEERKEEAQTPDYEDDEFHSSPAQSKASRRNLEAANANKSSDSEDNDDGGMDQILEQEEALDTAMDEVAGAKTMNQVPGNTAIDQVANYSAVLEDNKEQKKLITIQRAKITALHHELEDALKKLNLQEIELEDKGGQDKKQTEETKSLQKKLDQMTAQLNKTKQTNLDLQSKISNYES